MKKFLTIALALLGVVLIAPANAQTNAKMGFKGNLGIVNLTGDISANKATIGFGGGALFRYYASPEFSIQPELLISLKGTKEEGDDGEKLKLTYVEVPVLLMYHPPTKGNIVPGFYFGPQLSFLMSAKSGGEDIKDMINSTDFGLVIGAGIDVSSREKGSLFLDLRYALGLSNIAKESDGDSIKNGAFFLGISYLFPLRKN